MTLIFHASRPVAPRAYPPDSTLTPWPPSPPRRQRLPPPPPPAQTPSQRVRRATTPPHSPSIQQTLESNPPPPPLSLPQPLTSPSLSSTSLLLFPLSLSPSPPLSPAHEVPVALSHPSASSSPPAPPRSTSATPPSDDHTIEDDRLSFLSPQLRTYLSTPDRMEEILLGIPVSRRCWHRRRREEWVRCRTYNAPSLRNVRLVHSSVSASTTSGYRSSSPSFRSLSAAKQKPRSSFSGVLLTETLGSDVSDEISSTRSAVSQRISRGEQDRGSGQSWSSCWLGTKDWMLAGVGMWCGAEQPGLREGLGIAIEAL